MDVESDADAESVSSEMSLNSSSSSCEAGSPFPSRPANKGSPILRHPFSPEDLHKLIQIKKQSIEENGVVLPGYVVLNRVPLSFGEVDLAKHFAKYGTVLRVHISDKSRGKSQKEEGRRGRSPSNRVAYIKFSRDKHARFAAQESSDDPVSLNFFQCSYISADAVPPNVFSSSFHYPTKAVMIKKASSGRNSPKTSRNSSSPARSSSKKLKPKGSSNLLRNRVNSAAYDDETKKKPHRTKRLLSNEESLSSKRFRPSH